LVLSPGDQAASLARIESIKQYAWNFRRTAPFTCPQTTEGGDCSERRNEENDDNNLKEVNVLRVKTFKAAVIAM
jgi:hypothetical protein